MSSPVTLSPTPPVLLLCGLLCDASIWEHQRAVLAELAEVQVLDFRDLTTLSAMAAYVLERAPHRFALAGHSMGARVALEVLRLAPERVHRLALLDTGVHPRSDGEQALRESLVALSQAQGMRALANQWLPPMLHPDRRADPALLAPLTKMVERHTPQNFAGQVNALLQRPDAAPLLATIRCPTPLGVGRQDAWSPVARHQDMARQIPGAQLVVFEHSGHMAPVEAPEAVSSALRNWLQDA
ncbi:alpha/beta fold hydrolase [Xanthomonas populi]|uniref:Alpha/beta hydrolase n=1 Tax=Xanthomonas populi TaxID=53414 RepID=A0A2S7ESI3_9XANT|nr:alpha/beta hydrolase [Xanthomonas populi]PPU96093.1 alpha/beta hydrolase [Xanthomonas populi]